MGPAWHETASFAAATAKAARAASPGNPAVIMVNAKLPRGAPINLGYAFCLIAISVRTRPHFNQGNGKDDPVGMRFPVN